MAHRARGGLRAVECPIARYLHRHLAQASRCQTLVAQRNLRRALAPAAAESLDQEHRSGELLPLDLHRLTLIRQERLLRSDDIQKCSDAALIAVAGNIKSARRTAHAGVRLNLRALK